MLYLAIALTILALIVWKNHQDIKLAAEARDRDRARAKARAEDQERALPHLGFAHGGFVTGPWTWNRQQYYYHPGIGWYASPFLLG